MDDKGRVCMEWMIYIQCLNLELYGQILHPAKAISPPPHQLPSEIGSRDRHQSLRNAELGFTVPGWTVNLPSFSQTSMLTLKPIELEPMEPEGTDNQSSDTTQGECLI